MAFFWQIKGRKERKKDESKKKSLDDNHAVDFICFRKFTDSICFRWKSKICTGYVCVDIFVNSTGGGNRACINYKGSVQFPVCWYFNRRCFLVRVPV